MNKIKKLVCIMIAVFAISTTVYAVEFSIGASVGYGLSFLRGNDADSIKNTAEILSGTDKPSKYLIPSRLNLMLEVLPFFAIETGLGYDEGGIWYSEKNNAINSRVRFHNTRLYIPLMLRFQHEYKVGVSYLAVGAKFAFPEENFMTIETPTEGDYGIESSNFSLDVAFVIGQEFRLGKANYLGLRVGYDLNVVKPFLNVNGNRENAPDLFLDNLSFALTYRYAFGSKWKK